MLDVSSRTRETLAYDKSVETKRYCDFHLLDGDMHPSTMSTTEEDGFSIELASSYKFKIRSVDMTKLQAIRTSKNNKKRARLFQAMGLPVDIDQSNQCKKIIHLKRNIGTTTSVNTDPGTQSKANSAQSN